MVVWMSTVKKKGRSRKKRNCKLYWIQWIPIENAIKYYKKRTEILQKLQKNVYTKKLIKQNYKGYTKNSTTITTTKELKFAMYIKQKKNSSSSITRTMMKMEIKEMILYPNWYLGDLLNLGVHVKL